MHKINLASKLSQFQEHWSPKIVAELNGQHVKLVKFAGEFVWHKHDDEDELFLVISGAFAMHYREEGAERVIDLSPGEFLVVPRGVEHRPAAEAEVSVLLFEPISTANTGNATESALTVSNPGWL